MNTRELKRQQREFDEILLATIEEDIAYEQGWLQALFAMRDDLHRQQHWMNETEETRWRFVRLPPHPFRALAPMFAGRGYRIRCLRTKTAGR